MNKKLKRKIKTERSHIENLSKDLGLIFNRKITDEMGDSLIELISRINRYIDYQQLINQYRLDEAFTERMKIMLSQKMKDEENELE